MSSSRSLERALVDLRVLAQRPQHLLLPLELLQQVGLQVRARGDVGDLEQREQRGVVILRRVLRREVAGAREQVLEPHQRAYPFVERMFVADHLGAFRCCAVCAPFSGEREYRFKRIRARGAFAVSRVEARDLGRKRFARTAVVDDVVGAREALGPRKLRGHDRAHFRGRETAARHDPAHLLVLRTVDDKHARDARKQRAAFEQQRRDQNAVRSAPAGDFVVEPLLDQRMQQTFQPPPRLRVGKHGAPQPSAIEVTVGGARACGPNAATTA